MKIVKTLLISLLTLLPLFAFSGQISLMAENDVTYHTDRYFTHGTRLQYVADNGFGYALGQNMYTPEDKKATLLVSDDRPYAGYTYGSIFNTYYFDKGDFFVEGQIGVVGPDSYAGRTQIYVHKILGDNLPQGWDNQIANHFAFLLIDKYTMHIFSGKYFSIDPYIGSGIGNVAGYIDAGVNIFAGYNLPPDRNQTRVIPFKGMKNQELNPYGYVYVGIEPRLMMWNMLLEDDRFSIHENSYVYDKNIGMVFGCRYFELGFTLCFRSKEFEEQNKPSQFASVKISANV